MRNLQKKKYCLHCNKEMSLRPSMMHQKYCSVSCAHPKGSCTNTGRTQFKKGERISPKTEFKKGFTPWIKGRYKKCEWISNTSYKIIRENGHQFFEHHKVWCLANSLPVVPQGCVIHHINQNKLDNRPENLILLPAETHNWLHGQLRKLEKQNIAEMAYGG